MSDGRLLLGGGQPARERPGGAQTARPTGQADAGTSLGERRRLGSVERRRQRSGAAGGARVRRPVQPVEFVRGRTQWSAVVVPSWPDALEREEAPDADRGTQLRGQTARRYDSGG